MAGSTLDLAGFAAASAGSPRAVRSCSAHTGTGGSGAAASASAATASAKAALKASHTTSSCERDESIIGGYLLSTHAQFGSLSRAMACDCQCETSACKASATAWASFQALVDSSSMRCANNTEASRCTMAWFCRSSTTLTRSDNAAFNEANGSRDNGAPALAASRCQAMASAMLSRGVSSRTWPRAAHSAANASWVLARRSSSSFSRRGLAAPLSLTLSSLNTSCISSWAGDVASHSRTRAARSPEVAAVKAPPVRASSC